MLVGEGWLPLWNIWLHYLYWTVHHLIFSVFLRRKHYKHSLLNVTSSDLEKDPTVDTPFYSLCLESELSTKSILSGRPSGRKCPLPDYCNRSAYKVSESPASCECRFFSSASTFSFIKVLFWLLHISAFHLSLSRLRSWRGNQDVLKL